MTSADGKVSLDPSCRRIRHGTARHGTVGKARSRVQVDQKDDPIVRLREEHSMPWKKQQRTNWYAILAPVAVVGLFVYVISQVWY